MEKASKRIPFLLAWLLIAASLSGESSTGKTRATATTTVRVSIPALYGISLLEENAETSEPGGVVFASLADSRGDRLKFRLAIVTTMGDGSVVLRRSLSVKSPAGEPALLPAAHGKSRDNVSESPAFFFFPSGALGWKSLEERVGPIRSEPVSDGGNPRVKVVYELWQF